MSRKSTDKEFADILGNFSLDDDAPAAAVVTESSSQAAKPKGASSKSLFAKKTAAAAAAAVAVAGGGGETSTPSKSSNKLSLFKKQVAEANTSPSSGGVRRSVMAPPLPHSSSPTPANSSTSTPNGGTARRASVMSGTLTKATCDSSEQLAQMLARIKLLAEKLAHNGGNGANGARWVFQQHLGYNDEQEVDALCEALDVVGSMGSTNESTKALFSSLKHSKRAPPPSPMPAPRRISALAPPSFSSPSSQARAGASRGGDHDEDDDHNAKGTMIEVAKEARGEEVVGMRISVHVDDDTWLDGIIVSFNAQNGHHDIVFMDGMHSDLHLAEERIKLEKLWP